MSGEEERRRNTYSALFIFSFAKKVSVFALLCCRGRSRGGGATRTRGPRLGRENDAGAEKGHLRPSVRPSVRPPVRKVSKIALIEMLPQIARDGRSVGQVVVRVANAGLQGNLVF